MKGVLLLGLVLAAPLAAQDPWILQTGPEAVESIPVDPVQPVDAWRGLYSDGADRFWVYVTRSPHFFVQTAAGARAIPGTAWTVIPFFPRLWTPAAKTTWLDRWMSEFRTLTTYPTPGVPILFPSVLTKG